MERRKEICTNFGEQSNVNCFNDWMQLNWKATVYPKAAPYLCNWTLTCLLSFIVFQWLKFSNSNTLGFCSKVFVQYSGIACMRRWRSLWVSGTDQFQCYSENSLAISWGVSCNAKMKMFITVTIMIPFRISHAILQAHFNFWVSPS